MKSFLREISLGLLIAVGPTQASAQNAAPPSVVSAKTATAEVVGAAERFLATLDPATRAKGQFAFDDERQKVRWSNLPTGIFERSGLRMGDLTATQRKSVMELLATALSKNGFEKVVNIIEAEETLNTKGGGGGKLAFGRDEFYIAFLGAPSPAKPWIIQFGGHHLALNITIIGEQGILTPSHTAAQPATFVLNGKTIRPLGAENDKAFALIQALDVPQQKKAILGFKMRDLVLGPGNDGKTIQPEGIKASDLKPEQQAMLLDLASEWVGIINESSAKARMSEIKSSINDTWFAWSGPTESGSAAYFRIQGPTLFIEYAPQQMGNNPTQHIHTMYRDPSNEYGRKFIK